MDTDSGRWHGNGHDGWQTRTVAVADPGVRTELI
jgi:hypothetical protein